MTSVRFIVQNHLTASVNQQIQVFLRPWTIPSGADFFAWQCLNPASQGQQGFAFTGRLQVQVAEHQLQGSRSRNCRATCGDRLVATSEKGQGPMLDWETRDPQGGPAAVENLTQHPIRVLWLSENRQIMEQLHVGVRAVAEFELIPNLLIFRVAERASTARSPAPDLATDYCYVFDPQKTDRVWVTWQGEPGASRLVFHPASLAVEDVLAGLTAAEEPGSAAPPMRA